MHFKIKILLQDTENPIQADSRKGQGIDWLKWLKLWDAGMNSGFNLVQGPNNVTATQDLFLSLTCQLPLLCAGSFVTSLSHFGSKPLWAISVYNLPSNEHLSALPRHVHAQPLSVSQETKDLAIAGFGHMISFLALQIEPHASGWTKNKRWMDLQLKYGACLSEKGNW